MVSRPSTPTEYSSSATSTHLSFSPLSSLQNPSRAHDLQAQSHSHRYATHLSLVVILRPNITNRCASSSDCATPNDERTRSSQHPDAEMLGEVSQRSGHFGRSSAILSPSNFGSQPSRVRSTINSSAAPNSVSAKTPAGITTKALDVFKRATRII